MKSSKLKQQFKEKYESFYRKNNLVISLPLILNWAWDLFWNYKWIRIKQKLPIRLYLWINKINENKIVFNKISYFDTNEDKFINSKMIEYAPFFQQYSDYFNKEYLKEVWKKWWIEINILAEASRWVWLSFTSVVTLLLIVWLEKYYFNNNYIPSENIDINDFLNTNTTIDKLFRKTLKLNKDLWKRVNKIENQIASFFDSYYPIVSFTEDIDDDLENLDVENIKIYWYRLNSIEKTLPPVPFIPVDYWIIYSWNPVLTDHIIDTNENSLNWTTDIKEKLIEYFWKDLENTLPIRKPIFYKTFVNEWDDDEFKDTYWKVMWTISLEILNIMIKLFSSWYTESNMKIFIDALNKVRFWNYITRKRSKTFSRFIDSILQNLTTWSRSIWIAPSDTSVMWWTIIFALPLEWFRKDLLISIEKTNIDIPWAKLIYANWLDWIENKWFIVEQDLDNNYYSEFISKSSYIIKTNKWTSLINDITEIEYNLPEWLTIDLINRKMYLDWNKLTSKELHSQNTTIDILEILLENLWKDICSSEFPISSYTSNKNEMLWKIIIPLVKLVEEKKKIRFPLICKWSITNFYLKLSDSNLKINLIKKLS